MPTDIGKIMLNIVKILLTALLITTYSFSFSESLDNLKNTYRQSVIYISAQKANAQTGAVVEESGTGFIVNKKGYVITAAHVVSGGAGIDVVIKGAQGSNEGTLEGMEVILEDSNMDVALLRFKNTAIERKPIPIGDPWLLSGDARIYAMGYPKGEEWYHGEGGITGEGPKGSLTTTLVLNIGMSGGPIFNTDGRVVAMVWGGVKTEEVKGLNRILPINLLDTPLRIAGVLASTPPGSSVSMQSVRPQRKKAIEVTYKIDETQQRHDNLQPTSENYNKTFLSKDGYKIIDHKFIAKSANNSTVTSVQVTPDGKALTVQFSLKSGPVFDRWRGWLDAEIFTLQEPI